LGQNSKVLAFGSTEKCQFLTKTDQNSVFIGHDAHILDRLYIMVLYLKFYSFRKFQILAQNSTVLAFGFTEKCQFVIKIDRNYVFISCEAHIPDRLYIMVRHLKFYGF
jgi:hypothetical protein